MRKWGPQIISSSSTINGTNGMDSPAASSPLTAYMGVASMTTVSGASLLAGYGINVNGLFALSVSTTISSLKSLLPFMH